MTAAAKALACCCSLRSRVEALELGSALPQYTVDELPAGEIGMRAYVTDATAPTYGAVLVGGGAVVVPVFHNGVTWISA